MRSALAFAGVQGFLDESADHVCSDATFSRGDEVDGGDHVGVKADCGEVFGGHEKNCITVLDNVVRRGTVLLMNTTEVRHFYTVETRTENGAWKRYSRGYVSQEKAMDVLRSAAPCEHTDVLLRVVGTDGFRSSTRNGERASA